MLSTQRLKRKLRAGEVCLGTILALGSPAAAEIVAALGLDFVMIEGEHAAADMGTVQAMLQAMGGSDTVPVLRVARNDATLIKVALDVGVPGIVVPDVRTRADAEAAIRACKYPPAGIRGLGRSRASLWGLRAADYLQRANEETLVIPIIEHYEAIENLDEILSVPGFDAIWFGPADLSASLGLLGQPQHARVTEARQRMLDACRRAGLPAGQSSGSAAEARGLLDQGFTMVMVQSDASLIFNGLQQDLKALRH